MLNCINGTDENDNESYIFDTGNYTFFKDFFVFKFI